MMHRITRWLVAGPLAVIFTLLAALQWLSYLVDGWKHPALNGFFLLNFGHPGWIISQIVQFVWCILFTVVASYLWTVTRRGSFRKVKSNEQQAYGWGKRGEIYRALSL